MKMKWIGILLLSCGAASAQPTVFNNGIDVSGQAVLGVGLIDLTGTDPALGTMAPSIAQLAGCDPGNATNLSLSLLLILTPSELITDEIHARTTNGLQFFSYGSNSPSVQFNNGVLSGLNGLVIANATFLGNGSGLTGLTGAQVGINYYNVTNSDVAIGNGALGNNYGVAGGAWANATDSGVALGYGANGTNRGVAVGFYTDGSSAGTALGYGSTGHNSGAAVGGGANGNDGGAAIGSSANATNQGAAVGPWAYGMNYGASVGFQSKGMDNGAALGFAANGSIDGAAVGICALGTNYGVAMGCAADGHSWGVSLGYAADGSSHGVAVGLESDGSDDGTAVGVLSKAASFGTAVGIWSDGSNLGVAVGQGAIGGNMGTALGGCAVGAGLGNVALGGGVSWATAANVPTNWIDTVELGRGTAVLQGGLNFRGKALADSNGVIVANIVTTNLVATFIPPQGDLMMGSYTNQAGQ